MSEVLLKVEKSVKLRSPIIAVRMESSTPDEIYDKYIDKELFDIGQPTFYGRGSVQGGDGIRGMAPEGGTPPSTVVWEWSLSEKSWRICGAVVLT